MATVYIPAPWRDLTEGVVTVEVEAATLADAIAAVEARYPGIAGRACGDGGIAPGLAVSIDGAIASRGLRSPLKRASEVHFLPAIGGG